MTALNLENFNTQGVTSMYRMFAGCEGLLEVNLSSFNTANVHDMNGMFENCMSLTVLDISNFDIQQTKKLFGMFHNCTSLTHVKYPPNGLLEKTSSETTNSMPRKIP